MKKVAKMFAISMMVAMMSIVSVNAQSQGDVAVGADVSIGVGDSYTNIGLGAKLRYNIVDKIRLEGAYTSYLKNKGYSMWDLTGYAHYLFNVADGFTLYPLAGLGVFGSKGSGANKSYNDIVVTFGAGVDYELTDHISFNTEIKYKIVDFKDRLVFSAGFTFNF